MPIDNLLKENRLAQLVYVCAMRPPVHTATSTSRVLVDKQSILGNDGNMLQQHPFISMDESLQL